MSELNIHTQERERERDRERGFNKVTTICSLYISLKGQHWEICWNLVPTNQRYLFGREREECWHCLYQKHVSPVVYSHHCEGRHPPPPTTHTLTMYCTRSNCDIVSLSLSLSNTHTHTFMYLIKL